MTKVCEFGGCGRRRISAHWCDTHYRQEKAGQELRPIRTVKLKERTPRHGTPGEYSNHHCRCELCTAAWRDRHRESGYQRKTRYGVSLEQYVEMLEDQHGVCAICGHPETKVCNGRIQPLSVDHDHRTGKTRSLLCHQCNIRVGCFESGRAKFVAPKVRRYVWEWKLVNG